MSRKMINTKKHFVSQESNGLGENVVFNPVANASKSIEIERLVVTNRAEHYLVGDRDF